jgi:hypothetical protein
MPEAEIKNEKEIADQILNAMGIRVQANCYNKAFHNRLQMRNILKSWKEEIDKDNMQVRKTVK